MGSSMNLYTVSLVCIAISSLTAADVIPPRSRLTLTLIHWDRSNVSKSYFKLTNNPLHAVTYVVNVSSTYINTTTNATVQASSVKTLAITSDINGLAKVDVGWPNGQIGTKFFGLSVKEQGTDNVVSAQLDPTNPAAEIYYPWDEQTSKVSMIFFNGKWQPVWDNSDETWLIDEKNPQQLQVLELNSTFAQVYCFVCAKGLSSALGRYSLTIHGKNTNYTKSLVNTPCSDRGMVSISFPNVDDVTGYSFTFTLGSRTMPAISGSAGSLLPAAKTYHKVLKEQPDNNEIYMNEVHFPKLNGTKPKEKLFWIELIGRPGANLTRYCISLENGTSSSQCIGMKGVTTTQGYSNFSLTNLFRVQDFLKDRLSKIYKFRLFREDQVSFTLLDYVSFVFVNKTERPPHTMGSCVGLAGRCLQTAGSKCNALCLDIGDVLYTSQKSLSRCGIQKSPIGERKTAMSVWYLTSSSFKLWNKCPRPKGSLTRIAMSESMVTVSVSKDDLDDAEMQLHQHLPDMGLMLMFWQKSPSKKPPLIALTLDGADLSIEAGKDHYPMREMNITLHKKQPASVSGATLYAKGADLSSIVRGNIYAIALVHCYSFVCNSSFNITTKSDRVVDAVVYSAKNTTFDLQMVSLFMDMTDSSVDEQGQIVLDKVQNPILVSNGTQPRNTDSWKGLGLVAPYELDKLYVSAEAQKYIRIMRVGDNNNPYIQISLINFPEDFATVYSEGVPLKKLCLDVSVFAGAAQKRQSLNPLGSEVLQLMETKSITLEKFRGITDVFDSSGSVNYALLFRDANGSEVCQHPFTLSQNLPLSRDEAMNFMVDAVKLTYGSVQKHDALSFKDGKEAVRCNSMKRGFTPAYSLVEKGENCPVPHDLFIYKLCQRIIGIASDRSDFTPFPTDYLYLVLVDDKMKITNVTSLKSMSTLKFKYNVIPAPLFIIGPSNKTVLSFVLGWFPNGPPTANDVLVNHTLSYVVAYPNKNMADAAEIRHTKLLETAEHPQNADRPTVVYKPSAIDGRHCVIGCNKGDHMKEVINFEQAGYKLEDRMCQASYTKKYQKLHINEINSDTKGFNDRGEFIELKGPKGFPDVSGLSIAILKYSRGKVVYHLVQSVNDTNKAFSDEGYFVFERNESTVNQANFHHLPFLRALPNDFGAVALLWGAQLVKGVESFRPVLDEHIILPDFILDIVVYAYNHTFAHSDGALAILRKINTGPKTLKGNVAFEQLGSVNFKETISRCFCDDPWNMDCFEMSFQETENALNVCPNAFNKTMSMCVKKSELKDESGSTVIANEIARYMTNSKACNNISCAFSKYQVKGLTSCPLSDHDIERWTFTVGFPSKTHFDLLMKLVTPQALIDFGSATIVECTEDACPVISTAKSPHHSSRPAIIGGVLGGLAVILLLVFLVVILKKRCARRKDLTARFEAAHDDDADDATFLPDGGSISFSNPWYNQSNGSRSSSNGLKKEYHKLSTST